MTITIAQARAAKDTNVVEDADADPAAKDAGAFLAAALLAHGWDSVVSVQLVDDGRGGTWFATVKTPAGATVAVYAGESSDHVTVWGTEDDDVDWSALVPDVRFLHEPLIHLPERAISRFDRLAEAAVGAFERTIVVAVRTGARSLVDLGI